MLGERDLSRAALARKLRISRQAVGQWTRRDWPCPMTRQAQIAVLLEVRASYLFDADGWARPEGDIDG